MARANYKQNPNLQTWSSNTIKQRNVKTVKHATEFFSNNERRSKAFVLTLEKQLNNN